MSPARAVLLLAALLFFWNLGRHDLWAPDEPYFAEGAREMVVDGHWAVPHVNGEVTTDKPPLFFWLIALLSLPLGGVSALSARLPSALAALGSLALTLRLGRRLSERRTAALAGAILGTTYLFWDKARSAQSDSLLCFLVLVALGAFEAFRAGEAHGGRAGLLFWAAAALAVLVKGPVGFLLPLGAALLTLACDRDLGVWKRFAPLSGPALFAAIVGAWMVLATSSGGGEYSVWQALREHVLARSAYGLHHPQPAWYYLTVLPLQLLPWTGLLPGALLLAWRRRRSNAQDRFLLVWALFIVVFFSIPVEKRDLYVLPAYPAFALLSARLVAAVCGWEPSSAGGDWRVVPRSRWITFPLLLTGCLLAVAGLAVPLLSQRLDDIGPAPALWTAAALAVGGASVAVAAAGWQPWRPALTTIGVASVLYLVASTTVLPALDARNSARAFALQMRTATAAHRAAGGEVLALGLGNITDALAFYSDGVYVRRIAGAGEIAARVERGDRVVAVAEARCLAELPAEVRAALVEITSARLSRRKIVLVTSSRPAGIARSAPGE